MELDHGERRPRGRGLRRAVGELVTCTRCVGAWSALGIVGLRLADAGLGPDRDERAGRVGRERLAAGGFKPLRRGRTGSSSLLLVHNV